MRVFVVFLLSVFFCINNGLSQINSTSSSGTTTILPTSTVQATRKITPYGIIEHSQAYTSQMDFIFQHVNRSAVGTGLLLDYGMRFTDVAKYNGTLQTGNYLSRAVWQALYASLYSMKFNSNTSLLSPTVVRASIDQAVAADSAVINISLLNITYEKLKDNALSSNLVFVQNNQVYDTPNRPASPYETRTAFAATPLVGVVRGSNQMFRLREDFVFPQQYKNHSQPSGRFWRWAGLSQHFIQYQPVGNLRHQWRENVKN